MDGYETESQCVVARNFSALALAPTCNGDNKIMTYREYSNCWIVVRRLPSLHQIVLGRYRKRSEAEGHLALLRQQLPRGSFAIAFDAPEVRSRIQCD